VVRPVAVFGIVAALVVGLPMAGMALTGNSLTFLGEFPPRTPRVEHAPFSWIACALYGAVVLAWVVPFLVQAIAGPDRGSASVRRRGVFPWWGWAGVAWLAGSWALAWTRFTWFAPLQVYTFTPLWLGYIIIVNALDMRRTGGCLMKDAPGRFLLLFPTSMLFWWFFEYLNRFVQNWQYVGADYTGLQYVTFASLSFATVLPAVLSTRRLLAGFRIFQRRFASFHALSYAHPRLAAGLVLAVTGAGLTLVGVYPNYLFALLWVSPLTILVCVQALMRDRHVFSDIAHGDWRGVVTAAGAALVCGFFWEMWNFYSQAKWIYHVPFVEVWHVFEMPLLGFAGYLPFGVQCIAAAQLLGLDGRLPERRTS